jgi:type II secretory pathway pseudopilin PulG
MTLIELLIAMTVMSIGIAALVAGFSSGILAVNRARTTSTAGTLADEKMELYRQAAFTSPLLDPGASGGPQPGSDGHTYWVEKSIGWTCPVDGTATTSLTPPSCPAPVSRPVKLVTITVREGPPPARVLFSEAATFDASTG